MARMQITSVHENPPAALAIVCLKIPTRMVTIFTLECNANYCASSRDM